MIGSKMIRHDLRKARDIADAARLAAGSIHLGEQTPEELAYVAALQGAAAACSAAIECFDTALRISEEYLNARSTPPTTQTING